MSIIHSSSLAYSSVASRKLQQGRADESDTVSLNAVTSKPGKQLSVQPSSTEQFKTALSNAGLPIETVYHQPNNTMAQKAIDAYRQHHLQARQDQVAESISGIDVYA